MGAFASRLLDTRVGLVHNHQFGSSAEELITPPVRLDEVS
jgi:hypothetical protein